MCKTLGYWIWFQREGRRKAEVGVSRVCWADPVYSHHLWHVIIVLFISLSFILNLALFLGDNCLKHSSILRKKLAQGIKHWPRRILMQLLITTVFPQTDATWPLKLTVGTWSWSQLCGLYIMNLAGMANSSAAESLCSGQLSPLLYNGLISLPLPPLPLATLSLPFF